MFSYFKLHLEGRSLWPSAGARCSRIVLHTVPLPPPMELALPALPNRFPGPVSYTETYNSLSATGCCPIHPLCLAEQSLLQAKWLRKSLVIPMSGSLHWASLLILLIPQ